MNRHADAETLAAFREELLPRRKAARVSAHLAACPRCAALDADLAGVTAMLASTAAPPMPDALTARIEAALAAEAAARSATGAVPAAMSAADGTGPGARVGAAPGAAGQDRDRGTLRRSRRPGRPGPSRSRLALRVATVAAAVAVVAGGGYGVARLLSGSPSLTTATGSSEHRAFGSAASAKSQVPSSGIQSGPGANAAPSPLTSRVISSRTNYQRATLGTQASAILAAVLRKSASPAPSPPARENQTSGLPSGLRACVAHLAQGQLPLLIDEARYQGHPAVIIVLRPPPPARPRAVVLAPTCTATRPHILATATLPSSG